MVKKLMWCSFVVGDKEREAYMLSLTPAYGDVHMIQRDDLFDSVVSLYESKSNQFMSEYQFRIKFSGERAIDTGGMRRDMFSAVFDEAYEKFFDGSALLSPVIHPNVDFSKLPALGTIISHAYLTCGMLSDRIAFPCLAQCVLGVGVTIPSDALVEAFISSIQCT